MFTRMDLQTAPDVTLFSIPEVAERLSISQRSVYYLIKNDKLRAVDIAVSDGRSKVRVRSDDLANYIGANTRQMASASSEVA